MACSFENLRQELYAYPFSASAASDALTVADQTTGLRGEPVTAEERMRDMLKRHGPHSANARAHPQRERYIRAAAGRVATRLGSCGVDRAHQYIIGTG
jgi:hypothetical protein